MDDEDLFFNFAAAFDSPEHSEGEKGPGAPSHVLASLKEAASFDHEDHQNAPESEAVAEDASGHDHNAHEPTRSGRMNSQSLEEVQSPIEAESRNIGSSERQDAALFSNFRMAVLIPELPQAQRIEYIDVESNSVETILERLPGKRGKTMYNVEFTDGRREIIPLDALAALDNGEAALILHDKRCHSHRTKTKMPSPSRKRKRSRTDHLSSESEAVESDSMELDDELGQSASIGQQNRSPRRTRMNSANHSPALEGEEEEEVVEAPPGSTRTLRTRTARQLTLTSMAFHGKNAHEDQDELLHEPRHASSDEDDESFVFVTSDIAPKRGRIGRGRQKSKRLAAKSETARSRKQRTPDSDIEFEAPRRSGRSTQNKKTMRDAAMSDEEFSVIDEKLPAVPKAVSVRETFQPPPEDSPFASMHMDTCHTCRGTSHSRQMVHCQGCTLSFHRTCLGVRNGREHIATKVAEDNFVLQCKFCIDSYNAKDLNAPKQSICQGCNSPGRACAAFSEKRTSRQEERLREENGGSDPITPISDDLLNNGDVLLFRCVTCHRGWHAEHLPGQTELESITTDVKAERLEEFSIDWQCEDCGTAKHKIDRLVAWKLAHGGEPSDHHDFNHADEEKKEYLIKWETLSYRHCTWKPGAWVFGVAPAVMRAAFGKRAVETDLFAADDKAAIPDEYIMPDIIFKVKLKDPSRGNGTRETGLTNVANVSKVLVKFQGLGYDDVVWDSPPQEHMTDIYGAFTEAYYEHVEGSHFRNEPFSRIRERVKTFQSEPFEEIDEQPSGLKRGKLMGYQLEGLNWLLGNYHSGRSVVLADEMGLGKTIQVVGLVTSLVQDEPKCYPFLVVVPNATCPNWRREFKQWSPDLRVVTYHGGKQAQELAYQYELFPGNSNDMKAHVVIMSYDSAQDPRTRTLFKSVHWAGLVVDEGQRLKNDQNLLYGALQSMKIPFRLLLTGTPLQNNKRELFNLLQFIDDTQDATLLDEHYSVLDKETLPKLHEKIRPYFLRRTKLGVLKFLPPMVQIIIPVSMTGIQEKLSKSIMAKNPELIKAMFANSKMKKKERGSLNNILMQLRKCLCHPFVYSNAIEEKHHDPNVLHRNLVEASPKLILLETMLPKLKERGHRVLIFSQFLAQLDIIEDFLTGMGHEFRRLDGTMGSLEKQRRIDAFNAPDSPIFAFLLSTRAGGVGINLATADTVIILDPDFNPHQDIQALSRAHRIGQKRKVLCFQLVTKDSAEERIMQVGRKKMALDHALIESMDDEELAGDDLESIIKHGAQALFNEDYQKKTISYDGAAVDKLLDRTEVEETNGDEDGGDNQFSYARVWANEKSGFEDGLATEEQDEPMPLNSSVWDRILAEREEEARREAEAKKEVLGRGGRRRMAVNYKTNAAEENPLGGPVDGLSDSSDEFPGMDSGKESEEEDFRVKGKRQKRPPKYLTTPATTPPKTPTNKKHNSNKKPLQKPPAGTPRKKPRPVTKTDPPHPPTPKKAQSKGPSTPRKQVAKGPKPEPNGSARSKKQGAQAPLTPASDK